MFFSPCSRVNRNKLQVLPELLFQSNPKLGRLWVHRSCFLFFFFSSVPPDTLPSSTLPSLPSTFYALSVSWCCYVIHLKTWSRCSVGAFIRVEGSSPLPGVTAPLCAPVERWKRARLCVWPLLQEVRVCPEWLLCLEPPGIFIQRHRLFPA